MAAIRTVNRLLGTTSDERVQFVLEERRALIEELEEMRARYVTGAKVIAFDPSKRRSLRV